MDLMEELLTQLHLIIFKMTFQKPELIFVSPKTPEAKEVFQYDMDLLHTCKIEAQRWNDETGEYLWKICFLDERER
jgi:hypothetical protein